MPTIDPGNVASGTMPITGVTPLPPTDAVPMPMPIAVGEPSPDGGRMRIVAGTDGDDRLVLDGRVAFGGGGDDTFVLTSTHADTDGPEHLGTIMDFQDGDQLDLSQLGDKAAILDRTPDGKGGSRVSVDFDGDGKEDGFVIVHVKGTIAPDDTGVVSPLPADGEVHILPFPMPGDGEGEFHILPYPMPGDGEVTILSLGDDAAAGHAVRVVSFQSDWIA
jgi:hypothetical protein